MKPLREKIQKKLIDIVVKEHQLVYSKDKTFLKYADSIIAIIKRDMKKTIIVEGKTKSNVKDNEHIPKPNVKPPAQGGM